jgi:hypothetical protein
MRRYTKGVRANHPQFYTAVRGLEAEIVSRRVERLAVCLLALGLVCVVAASRAWASISISPAYVEVSLDKGRPAGRFEINNLGDEEERYRVKAVHFTFFKDGALREITPDDNSLAPWIKFNPKEFTLPPKTKQVVRFVIVPPAKLRQGEYWAGMELESLKTAIGEGEDASGRKLRLEVIASILVPIFGEVGDSRYEGLVKEVKLSAHEKGTRLEVAMANTGNSRLLVTGKYEIADSAGKVMEEGSLGKAYVLRGGERVFAIDVKANLPEGDYTVRIRCNCPQLKEAITGEQKLSWKPPSKP